MLLRLFVFLHVIFFFFYGNLEADTLNDFLSENELIVLKKSQLLVHNCDYAEAESLLTVNHDLKQIDEDIYLFLMQVSSFWHFIFSKNDTFLLKSISYAERNRENISGLSNRNLRNDFFLAATKGYLGLAYIKKGKKYSGISEGGKGYKILNKLFKANPDLHEAELGLGIYKAMVSKLPGFLRWIVWPFGVRGNYKEGIAHLRNASEGNIITKADALFWLAAVLDDDGNTKKEAVYDSLVVNYPQNPIYHILLARHYKRNKDYESAIKEFNLAKRYVPDEFVSIKLVSIENLGRCYYDTKSYEKSIQNWLLVEKIYIQKDYEDRDEIYYYLCKSYKELMNDEKHQFYYNKIKDKDSYDLNSPQ